MWAQERLRLIPFLSVSQQYSTNPLARSTDEIDDFITQIDPKLTVTGGSETGNFKLNLGAQARLYADLTDLNTLDPLFDGNFERKLTPRLTLFGRGRYSLQKNRDPAEEDDELLLRGRPDVTRTSGLAGLSYALDPRSSLSLSGGVTDVSYDQTEFSAPQRDQDSTLASLSYQRLLTARDAMILRLDWRQTVFPDFDVEGSSFGRTEQTNDMGAVALTWNRDWSPAWSTALTGGVRVLKSEGNGFEGVTFDDPSLGDLSLDETSTAFTGGATLTRRTKRSLSELSFTQETRPASGRAADLDVSTFQVSYQRSLTSRLELRLLGRWRQEEVASEAFRVFSAPAAACVALGGFPGFGGTEPVCAFEVGSETSLDSLRLNAALSWRMRRRLTTFISYQYLKRDSERGTGSDSWDDHRIQAGFRWAYEWDVP